MDKLRMMQWLIISALLYTAAMLIPNPQLQIVTWKAGHLTIAAFVGYWIDRGAFIESRITYHSPALLQIRRAIIIGAAMLATAMGM